MSKINCVNTVENLDDGDVKNFLAKVDRGVSPETAVDLVIQEVMAQRKDLVDFAKKNDVIAPSYVAAKRKDSPAKIKPPKSDDLEKDPSKKKVANTSDAKAKDLKGGSYTVSYHNNLLTAANEGTLSAEDFQKGLETLLSNKDDVMARLRKYNKNVLLNMSNQYHDSGSKKEEIVDGAYSRLYSFYTLNKELPTLSYFMGQGADAKKEHDEKILAIARSINDADLAAWAESRKDMVAKRKERKAEFEKAISDPETISEFVTYIRHHIDSGDLTFEEARLTLSVEKRRELDSLKSEKGRKARADRDAKNKTSISGNSVVSESSIIKTKHTKKGHDLFVVNAGDRVEKDVYKEWLSVAKRLGGYYSRFRGQGAIAGFQFTDMESAEAFKSYISEGDSASAEAIATEKLDAFKDNRAESAVIRLNKMAEALEERGEKSLNADRKENTSRRAGMAARAIEAAEHDIALAKTMRNISSKIESGDAATLDRLRTKAQVEMLDSMLNIARSEQVRAMDLTYADSLKEKSKPADSETVDFVTWPEYTSYRSNIASMARQALENSGTKQVGAKILKIADDVTSDYLDFARDNLREVSQFALKGGGVATFKSKKAAELSISTSGYRGTAVVLPVKRGENIIILSPSEAMRRGVWEGSDDKKITLDPALIEPLIGKARKSHDLNIPWYFEGVKEKRARLNSMGIENGYELRTAIGEFINLKQEQKAPSRIKELERAMVGRAKDGLDFFPTPASTADEMVSSADIKEGMSVLEPSAGMGHIAERIRETGVEPDVIEMSGNRRELLEEKGFNVVGNDFLDFKGKPVSGESLPNVIAEMNDLVKKITVSQKKLDKMNSQHISRINEGSTRARSTTYSARSGNEAAYRDSQKKALKKLARKEVESGNSVSDEVIIAAGSIDYDSDGNYSPVSGGGTKSYDRIIMNPPFSDKRDIEHVKHAYNLLNKEGRLVAIMGENTFFASDKKATAFRGWLEEIGATDEKLEEGTFKDASLPVNTGVNARMVVIDKNNDSQAPAFSHLGKRGSKRKNPFSTKAEVEDRLRPIIKKMGKVFREDRIHIIQSTGELPIDISQGARGMYYKGHAYLFADNIKKGEEKLVLLHEVAGHLGAEKMLGVEKFNALTKGVNRLVESKDPMVMDVLKTIKKYYRNGNGEYRLDKKEEAREIIAHIVQENPRHGFIVEAIAKLRMWAAERGFGNLDAATLRLALINSLRYVHTDVQVDSDGSLKPVYSFGSGTGVGNSPLDSNASVADSRFFEPIANKGAANSKESRSASERKTFFGALNNILGLNSAESSLLKSFDFNNASSTPLKGGANSAVRDIHFVGDILDSESFAKHGFSGLNTERQLVVMDRVFRIAHDLKISDSIVELIPVDMMNDLSNHKVTPKMLAHDISVLKPILSVQSELPVSVRTNISGSLVYIMAIAGAKKLSTLGGFEGARGSGHLNKAGGTFNDRHIYSQVAGLSSIIPYQSMAFDPMEAEESNILYSLGEDSPSSQKGKATWRGEEGTEGLSDKQFEALGKISPPPSRPVSERVAEKFDEAKVRWKTKLRQGLVDQYDSIKSVLGDKRSWMLAQMSGSAGGAVEMSLVAGQPYLHKDGVLQIHEDKKSLAEIFEKLGDEAQLFLAWVAANRSKGINERSKAAEKQIAVLKSEVAALKREANESEASTITVEGRSDNKYLREQARQKEAEIKALQKKADVKERLFDEADIDELINLNKNKRADGSFKADREEIFATALKEFEELHNSFVQIGVDTGLVSKEDAAIWREQGFYVPFYRLADEEASSHGVASVSGMVGQTAYKKMKGADMQLNDLMLNVVMNWEHLASASLKNQAAQSTLDSAVQMGIATKLKSKHASKKTKNTKDVFVRVNGKEQWYTLDDSTEGKLVLESVSSLNYSGMNGSAMKLARKFKRALTYGVTASPEFKIANLIRDSVQAIAVGDMTVNIAANLKQGWKETTEGSSHNIQATAAGGQFGDSGYIHGNDPDSIKLVLAKGLEKAHILNTPLKLKSWWNKYQDLGARAENINRAANIRQNLEKGQDKLTANFAGRDHLDFQRSGAYEAVRFLTQVTPFLNARLQGLDKLGRAMADPKQRAQMTAVMGVYAAASVLIYLYMKDDEDYKEAEDWERDTYHLIKLPDSDVMVRIPRPFELGFIASMVERGVEQFADSDVEGEVFFERLAHGITETLSFSLPQIIAPAMDIRANKSSFTGRNIESQSMQRLSPKNRIKPWTSQTAIGLSNAMSAVSPEGSALSPIQIDYAVQNYLGWMGSKVLEGVDILARPAVGAPTRPAMQLKDYPVVGRFFRDAKGNNAKQLSQLYDTRAELTTKFADIQQYKANGELEEYRKEMRENRKDVAKKKAYNKAGLEMSKLRNEITRISNGNASPEMKRARINRLTRKQIDIAKRITEKYSQQ